MRVLLVTGSLAPMKCGVGDYTLQLARSLSRLPNIDVAVLTSVGASERIDGANVKVFPILEHWGLSQAVKLLKLIRAWAPDVVHVQYPTQGYDGGLLPTFVPLLSFLWGATAVRTWHEIPNLRGFPRFIAEAAIPGPFVAVRPEFREGLHPLLRFVLAVKGGGFIPGASAIPKSLLSDRSKEILRSQWLNGRQRLIVFFGFLYPFKGADLLFDIADPHRDRLVFAGETGVDQLYVQEIRRRAAADPWSGHAMLTGFLPKRETADLLAVADAVVLPFKKGGGIWNSSIHAAVLQGTPVITTTSGHAAFDDQRNIYFAEIDDVPDMKIALNRLLESEPLGLHDSHVDEWVTIAARHVAVYNGAKLNGESIASAARNAGPTMQGQST